MPNYYIKEKFAWRPVLATNGSWIWWKRYIKLLKVYWGPAGEEPVIDAEVYTQGDWLLKTLASDPITVGSYTKPKYAKWWH
jgi:hypothetical protein